VCLTCDLPDYRQAFEFSAKKTAEMIDHLNEHIAAGHAVPADAFADLLRDQTENDAEFAEHRRNST
jgi:hypothetical protein